MQTVILHRNFLPAEHGIDTAKYSQEVFERLKKLEKYILLRAHHFTEESALEMIEVSRATFYRWRQSYREQGLEGLAKQSRRPINLRQSKYSTQLQSLVLKIRRENPQWGKDKIAVILKRDHGVIASASTIGRVLTGLIKMEKVKPVAFYFGRLKTKRKRIFDGHAKRWNYGQRPKIPGEFIQVDHAVTEVAPHAHIKQFDAICPITKIIVSQVYCRATSGNAALFLEEMRAQFPFPIRSIKVDGGSEFRYEFEAACKAKNIELYVLPPRSPKYNGNVERSHATVKYEFFSTYDRSSRLEDIRPELRRFTEKYNNYRPHQSLGYLTPLEFYSDWSFRKSQMC